MSRKDPNMVHLLGVNTINASPSDFCILFTFYIELLTPPVVHNILCRDGATGIPRVYRVTDNNCDASMCGAYRNGKVASILLISWEEA
jgi:hypothetical protein